MILEVLFLCCAVIVIAVSAVYKFTVNTFPYKCKENNYKLILFSFFILVNVLVLLLEIKNYDAEVFNSSDKMMSFAVGFICVASTVWFSYSISRIKSYLCHPFF